MSGLMTVTDSMEPDTNPMDLKSALEELRNQIDNSLTDAMKPVRARSRVWADRMNMYRGRQWSIQKERWPSDEVAEYDDRIAIETRNRIQEVVRIGAARWTREAPNFFARPLSLTRKAARQAKIATQFGRALFTQNIISKQTIYDIATAAHIYGGAFAHVGYDPTANYGNGELFARYRSVLDVYPDPRCIGNEDAMFMFVRLRMSQRAARNKWSKDFFGESTEGRFLAKDMRPEDGFLTTAESDADLTGGPYYTNGDNDLAEVHLYYEVPTYGEEGFQQGRMLVFSGPTILDVGPLPGMFPIIFIKGPNHIPNSFYADGVVEKLISLQKSMNFAASKSREAVNLTTSPPILAEDDSIEDDQLTDIAGQVVKYKKGTNPPQWMTVPNVEAVISANEAKLDEQFSAISNYSEVSAGKGLPTNASGRLVAIADGLSSTSTEPETQLWQDGLTKIAEVLTSYAIDNYDEGRVVDIVGKSTNNINQVLFSKDLFPEKIKFIKGVDDQLPKNPAVKRAEIAEYFGMGMFDPNKPGSQDALALMKLTSESTTPEDLTSAHEDRAHDEEIAFIAFLNGEETGGLPELDEMDNDDIHLKSHEEFYIREILTLPQEQRMQAKQLWLQHVQEHELHFQGKQQNLNQQQAMTNNSAPSSGANPPKQPGMESPPDGGAPPGQASFNQELSVDNQGGAPPS